MHDTEESRLRLHFYKKKSINKERHVRSTTLNIKNEIILRNYDTDKTICTRIVGSLMSKIKSNSYPPGTSTQ